MRSGRGGPAKVPAVLLVGFMGAGKTSVGRALAARLGWEFEDLDNRIERREGRTVPEIFRDSGEDHFRRAETEALKELLEELTNSSFRVVAMGGGAFVQQSNVALVRASGVQVVFLDAPVKELWQRCSEQAIVDGVERPLRSDQEKFGRLYALRRSRYLQAKVRIDTSGKPVDQVAAEVAAALHLET